MEMSNEIAPVQPVSLVAKFAGRYSVDKDKLLTTLRATAFRQRGDRTTVTNEQMMALLVVADQYKLNPFTKEIFAFDDKGSIIPVVSVDGWARIINEHPSFNGVEFRYAETSTKPARGKECPDWCEAIIHRKDRDHPTVIREYLDEVYQMPRGKDGGFDGPWQTHTKRFLRHKTLIQCARIAFGFAGIYDEDEAHRIVQAELPAPKEKAKAAEAALLAPVDDAEFTDAAPEQEENRSESA
jgi:phage recombination protein Bet